MSSTPDWISDLIRTLAIQSPVIIISLVGGFVALLFIRRCPGIAMLVAAALSLMLFTIVATIGGQSYFISLLRDGGDPKDYQRWMAGMYFVSAITRACALAMLIAAAFWGRPRKEKKPNTLSAI